MVGNKNSGKSTWWMPRGENNNNAKLTWAEVDLMRSIRSEFQGHRLPKAHPASLVSLAAQFGVSITVVSKICSGRAWTHKGMAI